MSETLADPAQTDTVQANTEHFTFQAEVNQVLDLVIHSLYSKKEIFLRELISNASDALDKRRFYSLQHPEWACPELPYQIQIQVDPEQRILRICDTGVGMTREEVIQNLGTIAESGTRAFLSQIQNAPKAEAADTVNQIGKFGVGFYAVFMVADRVEVITRHITAPADAAVHWISTGHHGFEIARTEKATIGTDIILHLKADTTEFADPTRLRHIIQTYSEHVEFPIQMPAAKKTEPSSASSPAEPTDDHESQPPQWETVNRANALWRTPKKEITDRQYQEFYQQLTHDFQDPWIWNHAHTEGHVEYTSLLYIPRRAPYDMWDKQPKNGLKLYVQRVFIMEQAEYFLPSYLRFVRGVIDSSSLPLNVSRELLQDDKQVGQIKTGLTKKVLGMIEKLAETPSDYADFWSQFGRVFKEGVGEDRAHIERIMPLLRFHSTHTGDAQTWVSLADYVSRMQPEQTAIYYLIADSWKTIQDNPHLEWYRQQGIEVLLLHDRIDEWMILQLPPFAEKSWKAVNQAEAEGTGTSGSDPAWTPDQQAFVKRVAAVLTEQVSDVRPAKQLVDSPACIRMDAHDWSMHMQKWMRMMGQEVPEHKPILELNLNHPLVKPLMDLDPSDPELAAKSQFLFYSAYLAETGQLASPMAFLKPIYQWLAAGSPPSATGGDGVSSSG